MHPVRLVCAPVVVVPRSVFTLGVRNLKGAMSFLSSEGNEIRMRCDGDGRSSGFGLWSIIIKIKL